jgi:hypothetical protein
MRTKSFLVLMLVAGTFRQAPASFTVRGHIHRLAQARFDRGQVGDLFQLNYVTMMFKPTAEQQAALNLLLEQQQDPSSPNYHHWLTPDEFGDRFGMSTAELTKVTTWLQERGFTLHEIPPGRNWVAFTGSARQMREAFNLRIHEYLVNGETHYAAANEPFTRRQMSRRSRQNLQVACLRSGPCTIFAQNRICLSRSSPTRPQVFTLWLPTILQRSTTSTLFITAVLQAPVRRSQLWARPTFSCRTFAHFGQPVDCRQVIRR